MSLSSTKEILSGKISVGGKVTLAGWIRTRRDSKAGFSFLAVNDGSGFDNVQVIAPNTLDNYEKDVLKLTTGCSVVVDGTLQASQGQGQAFEVVADKVFVMDKGKIVMEGTPREIFSNVEKLKEVRLDVPDVTEMAYLLSKAGLPIRKDILTREELVNELCRLS